MHFPNALDKLKKEKSFTKGLIPLILDTSNEAGLLNLITGSKEKPKSPLQFGANVVVLVKTQDSKKLSFHLCFQLSV